MTQQQAQTINLAEMEQMSSKGILLKYRRKSDKTIYSVKSIMIPNGSSPRASHHPLVLHNENLLKFPHNNLAKYYGYAEKPERDHTELLLFFEESEGTLTDYLQNNKLNKEDVGNMINGLIDVLMYVDRYAFALPCFISLNNILVTKEKKSRVFKLFGTLPYDEERIISDADLKWVAPEVYEKYKLKKSHLYINEEKAIFYSVGIVVIYAVLKEMITEGRDQVRGDKFTELNEIRENRLITDMKTKLASYVGDKGLLDIIDKLLVYNEKGRNDFRVWRLKYNENLAKKIGVPEQTNNDFKSTNESKVSLLDDTNVNGTKNNHELLILTDEKKDACCAGCSIF